MRKTAAPASQHLHLQTTIKLHVTTYRQADDIDTTTNEIHVHMYTAKRYTVFTNDLAKAEDMISSTIWYDTTRHDAHYTTDL